jgi:hypothetical protein
MIEFKMSSHLDQTTFVLLIFSVCAAALWLVRIGIAFWRTRLCPHCWYCGASKVVEAKTYRRLDYLTLLSLMVPLRCQGCLKRFYGIRGVRPATAPSHANVVARAEKSPAYQVPVRIRIPAFSEPRPRLQA